MGHMEVLPFDRLLIARQRVLLLYFLYYQLLLFLCRLGDVLGWDDNLFLHFQVQLERLGLFLRDSSPFILSLLVTGKRFRVCLPLFLVLTAHVPHLNNQVSEII